MSRATDKTGTKSVARKLRKTPRYRQAIIRKAWRESGLKLPEMPPKIADAIQMDSKAPENLITKTKTK